MTGVSGHGSRETPKGRPCSICGHPDRAQIDAALTGGRSFRDVSKQWNLSHSAAKRHLDGHIGAVLAKVGIDVAKQRAVARDASASPAYGASLLVQGTVDRESIALDLARQAGDLFRRATGYLDRFEDDGALVVLKPKRGKRDEEPEESRAVYVDPEAAEAFARVVAAASSAVSAAVSALGGGAGRHAELRGKLTGELKTTLTIEGALKVIFEKGSLTPEAREALRTEANVYMLAGIDAALEELPADRRAAARDRALDAAKAAWARKQGGAT